MSKLPGTNDDAIPNYDRNLREFNVIGYSDMMLRLIVAGVTLLMFVLMYAAVGYLVWCMYSNDDELIRTQQLSPADRVVDSKVLIALIAATAAQVGAMALRLAKYVFRNTVDDSDNNRR